MGRSVMVRWRVFVLVLVWLCVKPAMAQENTRDADADAPLKSCVEQTYQRIDFVVCRFDPSRADIRLFLNDASGAPYGHFNKVKEALGENGEKLVFAMNAGMYHKDRSPVGLYVGVEQKTGEIQYPLNDNDGPGNFHLKPNGVFYISSVGKAAVRDTKKFKAERSLLFRYATQSGPMLVIDGKIHPRFLKDSDSLKRRNGVGVTEGGEVIFVLADTPVRFYDFAVFFRDELKTPNALFLDGTISRLYAPELGRNDPGAAMGPIVGVVAKTE